MKIKLASNTFPSPGAPPSEPARPQKTAGMKFMVCGDKNPRLKRRDRAP